MKPENHSHLLGACPMPVNYSPITPSSFWHLCKTEITGLSSLCSSLVYTVMGAQSPFSNWNHAVNDYKHRLSTRLVKLYKTMPLASEEFDIGNAVFHCLDIRWVFPKWVNPNTWNSSASSRRSTMFTDFSRCLIFPRLQLLNAAWIKYTKLFKGLTFSSFSVP